MAGAKFWSGSTWTDAGQLACLIDPDNGPGEAAGQSLPAWYARLIAEGQTGPALNFVAHALPRYECIVWAAQALMEIGAAERTDPLMTKVLRWIDSPDDGTRRAAADAGEAVRQFTPPKLLAQAVFFSGGSIAPADMPAVQPPPGVCARMAAGAVLMGAHRMPAPKEALTAVLLLGERMAAGA
jgi:hypothetical protein